MQPSQVALKLVIDELGLSHDIRTRTQRKELQKGIYLGQLSGVDLGYRFNWYVLGPYSPSLTRDYYKLAEAIEAGEAEHEARVLRPEAAARLGRIKPLLDPPADVNLSRPDWLELVASVHYLLEQSAKDEAQARETMLKDKARLAPYFDIALARLRAEGVLTRAA